MKNEMRGVLVAGAQIAALCLLAACGAPTSPHPKPEFVDCSDPANVQHSSCAIPEWSSDGH